MNDLLESQLRSEMQSNGDSTPPADWATIVQGADRLQRRDRMIQRFAVAAFVAAMGAALALAGSGWSGDRVATPADTPDEPLLQGSVSTGHLIAGILTLGALGVAFVIAARRRPPSTPWSFRQRYLLVPPLVYPLIAFVIAPIVGSPTITHVAAIVFKLQTVVCLPILLYLLVQRIDERPGRALGAVGAWSTLGIGVVLVARAFIDDIVRLTNDGSEFRLWPEAFGHNSFQETVLPSLDQQADERWNPATILQVELISVVFFAFLAGAIVWALRRAPSAAVAVLACWLWLALGTYSTIVAPMGFLFDYDMFLGDIALSATFMELTFFPVPIDLVGMLNVSAASLSLGALLWLWGDPETTGEQAKQTDLGSDPKSV